uniref:Uncharacterized protein n=1 Tax=Rhizophagus irregularis (strain DAOM 181602 / DAOM 197198 / MUCL 43194) TaxID=747089 RepID=U9TBI0_RHIID
MYGNLHITYKKTLQKALQKKFQSLQLIEILENFTNEDSSKNKVESNNESKEELGDVNDRSNEKQVLILIHDFVFLITDDIGI